MTKERLKDIVVGLIDIMIENSNERIYVIEDCYSAGISKDELIELGFDILFDED